MRPARRLAPLLALLAAPLLLAGAAEVYGRPLRGLSAAPIAEVAAHPGRHRGHAIRVSGRAEEASAARLLLAEGGATLALESDGTFALPAGAKGATVTAEGKLREGELVLVASGLEVRR